MDRLRFALERIAKYDIGDHIEDTQHRVEAHALLRLIGVQTTAAGFSETELYQFLIGSEEARIDFETEQAGE